ncbi:LPS export ABC transporter periplasmic protein LptC [Eikenella sp. S3360]|uniref:LPS export ABC transporter periplasmic protein LptC n=1 Tax=Eikenella glucosivorans TaxID=2766967 RepID=A0ABS0N741_9NEIS|nr:LPS export ABC transporter periplasmic protein LptC [Eikenella glucosivorans]MBH5328133.1 LPS export ABC transporter periplasmic protein LptC [Eikenella glucosivorans]
MIKRFGGWWFPLVLALALGGVSFWLDRISQLETEETPLDPREPQYQIFGIQGRRFAADGSVAQQLTASRAWQFPNRKDGYLADPEIEFAQGGQMLYRISARQAHYLVGENQIVFEKNVVFDKPATAAQPAGRLETDSLTVNTQTQTAHTQALVNYRYGASHGTAQGMTYNHKQGLLNLSSRIKAVIYDPQR